jgi:hypothetical protein
MFQRIEKTCSRQRSAATVVSVFRTRSWRYAFMSTTTARRMTGMSPPTIICIVT